MNPFVKKLILGQLRHSMTAAAGFLVANGVIAAEHEQAFVGIAIGIIGAVWSAVDKRS